MHSDIAALHLEQTRFNMIEQQIRPWEVLDADVLRALAQVKRELFLPPAHVAKAFVDMEVPFGKLPDQVMLAPRVEARMVQDLHIQRTDSVLEIGTGTGHVAALLGALASAVLSIEIDAQVAAQARSALSLAGAHHVQVEVRDGALPLAQQFDAICVSGALAVVPQSLKDALKIGGRLIAVVGSQPMMRATVVKRVSETAWLTTQPWDTVAPVLRNFARPSSFAF